MKSRRFACASGMLFLLAMASCGWWEDAGPQESAPASGYPRFAYVANSGDGTVSIFRVDAATGQLHHRGYVPAGSTPQSVAVDHPGRFAYVANFGSDSITTFSIDAVTGALSQVGPEVATGVGPRSVTIHPSGRFAYAANSGGNVTAFRILATGILIEIGTETDAGNGPRSITVHPGGRFAYVANEDSNSVTTLEIDQTSGALTRSGADMVTGIAPRAVTLHPSGGFAYVANFGSGNVTTFSVSAATGALTFVGTDPVGTEPHSVTLDASGRFAYVANFNSGDVTTFSVNATTGALTKVGTEVAAGSSPRSVTLDPSGRFAYAANFSTHEVTTLAIDAATGALSALGRVRVRSEPFGFAMTPAAAAPVTVSSRFAYVANAGGGVSQYTIGTNGSLAPMTPSIPALLPIDVLLQVRFLHVEATAIAVGESVERRHLKACLRGEWARRRQHLAIHDRDRGCAGSHDPRHRVGKRASQLIRRRFFG